MQYILIYYAHVALSCKTINKQLVTLLTEKDNAFRCAILNAESP
ncbi:MAG: hypothetical protein JWR50_1517 [Mucilaginibacter sp.]|nr:hypothetical protein [Mucilaginibacter sp.]